MTAKWQREIVVEFEMLKRVRKRAKTVLAECGQCGISTDLVLVQDAATLFELETDELMRFAAQNGCHYQILVDGDIYLCVVSLLDRMKAKNQRLLA